VEFVQCSESLVSFDYFTTEIASHGISLRATRSRSGMNKIIIDESCADTMFVGKESIL